MSNIDLKDYSLILALEKNPLISLKELSRIMNASWSTIKKRYNDIKSKGILYEPHAIPVIEEIGLNRIIVLAITPSYKAMEYLEQACDLHPYTKYRSRMIGNTIGQYIVFDIPSKPVAQENLTIFFNLLLEMSIISKYSFHSCLGIRQEIFSDLEKFDIISSTWDYSWSEWFDNLDNQTNYELPLPKVVNNSTTGFTTTRFNILEDLSKDASLKQADFMDKYNLSRTDAYRQYTYVRKNFIRHIHINFDNDAFDLTETFVFIISNITIRDQARLYTNIQLMPPPFRLAIEILENDRVLIWSTMSLQQANSFIFQLWKRFADLQIWRLSSNNLDAYHYYFYPHNFDFESSQWKISKNYMIDQPINELDIHESDFFNF